MTKEDLEVLHERLDKLDKDKKGYLETFKHVKTVARTQTDLIKQALASIDDLLEHAKGLEDRILILESGGE